MTQTQSWRVADLIPHASPMILIDEVISCHKTGAKARVYIGEDKPFYEPRYGVPSWVGIEYMAQTIAAFSGIERKENNLEIGLGFLIGSRRYKTNVSTFKLGATLVVSVVEEYKTEEMRAFDCEIHIGNVCVAEARLSVYVPANIDDDNLKRDQ